MNILNRDTIGCILYSMDINTLFSFISTSKEYYAIYESDKLGLLKSGLYHFTHLFTNDFTYSQLMLLYKVYINKPIRINNPLFVKENVIDVDDTLITLERNGKCDVLHNIIAIYQHVVSNSNIYYFLDRDNNVYFKGHMFLDKYNHYIYGSNMLSDLYATPIHVKTPTKINYYSPSLY
jgi:hypothetical protein